MTSRVVRVIAGGLLTTVQDAGRWGHQRFGVGVAGPMDMVSHRLANLLIGNTARAATLEATLRGPTLEFESATIFAVTGGEFDTTLSGVPIELHVSHRARPGDRLEVGVCRAGARAYVAVAGGFDVPPVLGSRSTHVASRMGGVDGRPLREGDRLVGGQESELPARAGARRARVCPVPHEGARVRVIAGPPDRMGRKDIVARLSRARYVVSAQSDRMGYRLEGPAIEVMAGSSLISSALPMGGVQVPPQGEPIVLMADHQTTGGYPQVATVISADLPMVGQLAPAAWIEFEVCDRGRAVEALIAQERRLMG